MEFTTVVRQNWLTQKPKNYAIYITYALALVLTGAGHFSDWLSATPEQVFQHKEYWRAWTALLAHADLGHLLSNSMILLPLAHFLSGYYGWLFFPVLGLAMGGVTNLLVLKTMPATTALLGISGVVNWMGAAWLTLFVLIDRRESPRRRVAVAVMLTMMLFVPDTFRPEISYLSHFIGFVLGTLSALAYYFLHRTAIEATEVKEVIYDDEPDQQPILPPVS
jgi:rhomboid protease GluP